MENIQTEFVFSPSCFVFSVSYPMYIILDILSFTTLCTFALFFHFEPLPKSVMNAKD